MCCTDRLRASPVFFWYCSFNVNRFPVFGFALTLALASRLRFASSLRHGRHNDCGQGNRPSHRVPKSLVIALSPCAVFLQRGHVAIVLLVIAIITILSWYFKTFVILFKYYTAFSAMPKWFFASVTRCVGFLIYSNFYRVSVQRATAKTISRIPHIVHT